MNKEFRAYDEVNGRMIDSGSFWLSADGHAAAFGDDGNIYYTHWQLMQWTGLYDRNGVKIFESDVLRFADKWEWYRSSGATKEETNKLPYEQREIILPECYEWLLSSEIQTYWEVAGNIYSSPELLKEAK